MKRTKYAQSNLPKPIQCNEYRRLRVIKPLIQFYGLEIASFLSLLIEEESRYIEHGELAENDGWFIKYNSELQQELNLSVEGIEFCQKELILAELISVASHCEVRDMQHYKIHHDKIRWVLDKVLLPVNELYNHVLFEGSYPTI